MCPRVSELLSESEVDGVDQVPLLAEPHQEIVRLDVAVDEVLAVDELDAADLLAGFFLIMMMIYHFFAQFLNLLIC